MKKLFLVIISIACIFSLFGCKKGGSAFNLKVGVLTLDNSQSTGVSDEQSMEKLRKEGLSQEAINSAGNKTYVHFDSLNAGILGLDKGDVLGLQLPKPVCDYIVNQNPDKYKLFDLSGHIKKTYTCLAMASTREHKDIIDSINAGIEKLIINGALNKLNEKYISNMDVATAETIPHFDGARTIKVAVTGDLPPFDYMDASGNAKGFNIALLSALGNELHVNFELVSTDAGSRAISLSSGKADIVFWVYGLSLDEGKTEDFSEDMPKDLIRTTTYAISPMMVVVKK